MKNNSTITGALSKLGLTNKREELNNSDIRTNPNIPLRDRESIAKLWDVISSGKKYSDILEYVEHEITESTRVINFDYQIDCFLSDGAYALSRAVEDKIGFTKQSDIKGMSGDNPPQMINIAFSDGSNIKVPFGKISLPIFGEEAFLDMNYDSDAGRMYLRGQCEKRFVNDMDDIINRTKHILATDSIYKAKAIKFVAGKEPEFIDISSIERQKLYLTKEARFATQPIEARIEKTELCVANNIDLKMGVLLNGKFGTGKTLYAFKLAKKAIDNGWLFLYVKEAKDTLEALKLAQKYATNGKGIVCFVEDIETVLNKRDATTNEISLLLDGGESKSSPVITVFTTNHIDKINPVFLRGKRIGSIVTLEHPDKETALEILENSLEDITGKKLYRGSLEKSAQLIETNKIVPAFVAEIVERVKTHLTFSGQSYCTDEDIILAINSYKAQIELSTYKDNEKTDADILSESLTKLVEKASKVNAVEATINDISNEVDRIGENF